MSFKSIEMQVAIPRTQDAGKLQDQMLKQGGRFQESLAQSQLQQEEMKRTQVRRQEQALNRKVDEEKEKEAYKSKSKKKKRQKFSAASHPYKGAKIDLNG